jgi:hypothetical protein
MDTMSDEDEALENRDDSISFSGGTNSLFFELPDSKENNNLCSGPNENFRKSNVEHSWSDLSSMESFGGLSSRKAISSGNAATRNLVAALFAGNGSSSTTPVAGAQLQKFYDLPNECENDILGMSFVGKKANTSSPSLEVLLRESSDSEAQTSDLEDINAGFDSDHLFTKFSSSDDDDAFATDKPLVDVPVPSETNAYAANEPLVDFADLTNPSGSVNNPFADVADLAEPSNLYASAVEEFLASGDDLPKTSETFVGGSSGEHPNSLI